jgi:hypothetical protein
MNSKAIARFEFHDFINKGEAFIEEKDEVVVQTEPLQEDTTITNDFAEQNAMSEIGYNMQPNKDIENINLIKITKDELDALIEKAKSDAVNDYINNLNEQVQVVDTESQTQKILVDIKERVELELDGLLDKIVNLMHSIAVKMFNLQSIALPSQIFVENIKKRITALDFKSTFALEVASEDIALLLRQNGIEVSVNNDMLVGDYKIVWCNGFLEHNTAEISTKIEKILIDQINKI